MEGGEHTVSPVPKLRLRGTFIDLETPDQTPRAQSEPRNPVHDHFYFEEEREYVAQLSRKKWCSSQDATTSDAGIGEDATHSEAVDGDAAAAAQSAQYRAAARHGPGWWQPLTPRRDSAGDASMARFPSSASDSFSRGNTPQRCTEGGSKESAPMPSTALLSLWDLLGKSEHVDEGSPCPSWRSNVGSGSGKANEADLQSGQEEEGDDDDKCDSSVHELQRGCGSDFCESGEATPAIPREWEARNSRGTLLEYGTDAASEPTRSSRAQRKRRAPWLYHEHPAAGEVARCFMLPEEAEKHRTLAALSGQWQVGEDQAMEIGIWTIQDGGKAFFNGERFGNDYDIFQQGAKEGRLVFARGDGWTAQMDSLESDQLVWTKPGEVASVTWKRKSCPSGMKTPIKSMETHTELRSKMEALAQQLVSGGWRSTGRLSSALAVIEEIPMRISEDMQRAASYVVDSMQSEVAAVSKQIRGGDWGSSGSSMDKRESEFKAHTTEKVIKHLEAVPTMVSTLLEARVEKARNMVTHRVRGMIQNLSVIQEENWEDHEKLIVSQMRLVSEEVEKIAGDAVKAAAQECHAHASRQLDSAFHTLRHQQDGKSYLEASERSSQHEAASGRWEVKHDPEFWPKTAAESNNTKNSLEHAAAFLQNRDYIPQSIMNQVVANELLRARIRSGGGGRQGPASVVSRPQSSRGGVPPPVCSNPGSQGHPDFCRRPCVYHSLNRCQNGEKCSFCHMLHPKRQTRLDKHHRDKLKKISFGQLASIMFPVLKRKAVDLDFNAEVCELLEKLWPALEEQIAAAPGVPVTENMLDAPMISSQVGASHHGFEGVAMNTAVSTTSLASATPSSNSVSGSERSSRQRGGFSGTFHIMGFRSLLAMLVSKVPPELVELRDLIHDVLQKARETRESGAVCSEMSWSASETCSNLGSLVCEEGLTLKAPNMVPKAPTMVPVIPEAEEARPVQHPEKPKRSKRRKSRQRAPAGTSVGMPAGTSHRAASSRRHGADNRGMSCS